MHLGEYRWLTVVSPAGADELELLLEPNDNPAAQSFQQAMFEQGIPLAAFETDAIAQECSRLKALGVTFTQEPAAMGPAMIPVLSDTCGNLLQLYQLL